LEYRLLFAIEEKETPMTEVEQKATIFAHWLSGMPKNGFVLRADSSFSD
jgi:hypothetical protein